MLPLTVTQLNNQVKTLLTQQYNNINVVGEINNLKKYNTGHLYFILKDESSEISCIMFNNYYQQLDLTIKDGDKVILTGDPTLYLPKGNYQFSAKAIKLINEKGNLYKEYEALKRKLNSEGLFNVKHKKRIPNFPSRIGIVTSLEGSVIQDIINVSQRRTGTIDLIVSSSPVQGEKSSGYLVDAITKLTEYNKLNKIDIIIIARGGGSFEDLNCFNSEKLARKIFDLDIPIISGIGHETDYTIVDFVVDLRASTPSQAAELSTPNDNETIQSIDLISDRMSKLISDKVYFFNENFNNLNNRINLCNPSLLIKNYKQKVLNIRDKFLSFYKICKDRSSNNIKYYDKLLVNNNPYNILKRGFVVATNQNGKLIKKVKNINLNDKISVKFYDGLASTIVDSIDYENEKE